MTRSATDPAGDTLLLILLAHAAALAVLVSGLLVLSLTTVAQRVRSGAP